MKVEELKQERDKLNDETKKLISESRESTSRVRTLRSQLNGAKAMRDEKNKQVQEFKLKRDEINAKIKAKISELVGVQAELSKLKPDEGVPLHQAQRELKALEWKVQTDVLNVKAEEKLVRRISELEKICATSDAMSAKRAKIRDVFAELDELRKESQAYHEVMLQHAKDSELHHDEVKKSYDQIKKIEPEFKGVQESLKMAKRQADEAHKAYLEKYKEAQGTEKVTEERQVSRKTKELRAEAAGLMKAFMEGKKLTTEELMVIQAYGGDE